MKRLCLSLVSLLVLAACGSDGDGSADRSGGGKTETKAGDELVVQVASYDLAAGPPARVIAGVLTPDQRLVAHGTVAMRFSFLGTKQGGAPASPGPVTQGSYLPLPDSEVPEPAPAKPQIVTEPSVRGVYATQAGFDRAGFWQVEITAELEGRERKGTAAFTVLEKHAVPAPGDRALATDNLTLSDRGDAPIGAVDSRGTLGEIPDQELHRTTIAAALAAKRPVVAVFATPVYCQSRFCGPVTDMVQGLARDYGDRASFVHIEVWRDFQNKVINKSAADWILRNDDLNEPWVFVVGADGAISARFDNVATRGEIEPLLRQLPVIGPAA